MQACNVYIGKYGTVCASSGKVDQLKCYCNQDPGFGTISDCLVRGYNNDTSIIDKFVDKCNMTESKFYKNTTESRKSLKPMVLIMPIKRQRPKQVLLAKPVYESIRTASVSSSTGKASLSTQKVSPNTIIDRSNVHKRMYAMSYITITFPVLWCWFTLDIT